MAIKQSRDELLSHLREQIGFLRASCKAVDEGLIAEAKRIAAALRLLLHDTGRSQSLLGQLGILKVEFFGTAGSIHPLENLTQHSLLGIEMTASAARYRAPLADRPPHKLSWMNFEDWWNQPVFLDRQKRVYSRKELVLSVANQDGGVHVDPTLDDTYADLTRGHSVGWTVNLGGREEPMGPSPALLSLRQIGFEVLTTIERHVPEIRPDV